MMIVGVLFLELDLEFELEFELDLDLDFEELVFVVIGYLVLE